MSSISMASSVVTGEIVTSAVYNDDKYFLSPTAPVGQATAVAGYVVANENDVYASPSLADAELLSGGTFVDYEGINAGTISPGVVALSPLGTAIFLAKNGQLIPSSIAVFGDIDTFSLNLTYGTKASYSFSPIVTITSQANGVTEYTYSGGLELSRTIINPDRSRDYYNYSVVGQPYAAEHTHFGVDGKLEEVDRETSAGVELFHQVINADGSSTTDRYDALGVITSDTSVYSGGFVDQDFFVVSGKPGATEHDTYFENSLVKTDILSSDGSHKTTVYENGVTLTASPGIADTFTSHGTNNTFIYNPAVGHEIINGFDVGRFGGDIIHPHDVIQLNSNQVASFAILETMISSPDHYSTLIQINPTTSIQLTGVSPSSLRAADFHIVAPPSPVA